MVAAWLVLATAWTAPQTRSPGIVAADLRARAAALYAALETPTLRLVPDTAKVPDTLRCAVRAHGFRLERDGGARPGGSEVLRLAWTDSVGAVVRQDLVSVRIERSELVPVARTRFHVGQLVDTTHLEWSWRRTDGVAVAPPSRTGLHGRALRRGVGPGQELTASALEEPFLFRRHETVRISLSREGTSLVAEGRALDDGLPGRMVKVEGPFGKTLRGRVMPDSTVRVQ